MHILIIGNGGREHALAWKVAKSSKVTQVWVAPGNAGTALEAKVKNIDIAATDIEKLAEFAKTKHIQLTIVGPEAPLAAGIVDKFQALQLPIFGPTKVAAQIESSKVFSKQFMQRHHIPTAEYATFTNADEAKQYINQQILPVVIKADGLAAGKGVVIAKTLQQANQAIDEMLHYHQFGEASQQIVVEQFISGEEVSFIVMTDGEHIVPLVSSHDYKARDNGDKGPNTGGMGAYSPTPIVTPECHQQIIQQVIQPTLKGLAAEGIKYSGFLYAGLMITPSNDIYVLEFNCRLGDPETQCILMRLQSDLVEMCQAALNQQLNDIHVQWDQRCALGVVLAAGGYPLQYSTNDIILGLTDHQPSAKIFHAGTRLDQNNQVLTNGGRVLCVTTLADNVPLAKQNAYQLVATIEWPNMYYRTDIGDRAIDKETANDEHATHSHNL